MPQVQPNILLVTSEDNGPNFGCYGDPYIHTPHVDGLAADGVRFQNAYCTQAVCSPGRASILTGLYPHQNGQIGNTSHNYRLYDGVETLPQLLQAVGYRTGLLGKLHVAPESACPFDYASDPWGFDDRDVRTRAANAESFMNAGDDPFFLMVNYRDAHLPWFDQQDGLPETPVTSEDVSVPPAVGVDTPRLRECAASYYNSMQRLDAGIGLLLDALDRVGAAEETIVIYVADHGTQFSRGKLTSYEMGVRVPMIIRWPGVSHPGSVRSELVSQIDVMPTVLDAVGLTTPDTMAGRSLWPLLTNGRPTNWRTYLFTEANARPDVCYPQRTVRDDRYKLIHNLRAEAGIDNPRERYYTEQWFGGVPGTTQQEIDDAGSIDRSAYERWRYPPEYELYDLQTDPHEFHDLSTDPAHAETLDRLRDRLKRWQSETGDRLADPSVLERFVEEHARANQEDVVQASNPDFSWTYHKYLDDR